MLGRGSRLIGGTISADLAADKASSLLLDGFFPACSINDKPARRRASGFREIGLPFESDTGVTRHLAGFLSAQGDPQAGPVRPTHVLLNGGVFKADRLRERLFEVLAAWFPDQKAPQQLAGNHDLDLAVARGAAYYGAAKQGRGLRIRGGAARSYYVGIETAGLAIPGAPRPLRALCVVPFGMEEGTETDVPSDEIGLVVGEPAAFRFFSSLAQARSARHAAQLLERRRVGRNRFAGSQLAGHRGIPGPVRAGQISLQDHRVGRLRAVVREHGLGPSLEAGVQRPRRRGGHAVSQARTDAEQPSRYVVGIDLGTTNSALAFVDTTVEPWQIRDFPIAQIVAPGVVETRDTLPSFHYQRAEGEFPAGSLGLPWAKKDNDYAVGLFAREHGVHVPGRLITSAKSWLCHPGVDRLAELLPWHGADDVERLSPVEASARYLAHLRDAWNARFPADPLESQEVVLTLPASFDEVARELTVKAAARAGLPRVVLIEEPQAAFYAWINAHGGGWEQMVSPGQKILVCDIGGGTSDFTLIRGRSAAGGKVQFHRVAVNEHLILGGDNLDLALAHHIEQLLNATAKLEPRQWATLVQLCRQVKETLLADDAPERLVVSLPGSGSRLIGGALQVEVSRDEVRQLLVDGFLPRVALEDKPTARRSGFQEFGLPYAPDPAISRYLAHSWRRIATWPKIRRLSHGHDPARPDIVLFNGGFFASSVLRARLLEILVSWFRTGAQNAMWQPIVLDNDRLDLAVARGAAYYGMVRRGLGVRISAQLARSYYVGVAASDSPASAMCLVPGGVEEGQSIDLSGRRFDLLLRQPVEFPLYVSSTLLTTQPGEMVPIDPEQMTALPPIRTVLQAGKKTAGAESVQVTLHARLTEIGTLELWCSQADGPQTWKLQFDVRAATQTDMAGHAGLGERQGIVDEQLLAQCRALVESTFGLPPTDATKPSPGSSPNSGSPPSPGRKAGDTPEALTKRLAEATGMSRQRVAPVAIARAVGNAHRVRSRAQAQRNTRSPLVESARLRSASRLRHGAR